MNLLIESVEGGIYLAYNVENHTKSLILNEQKCMVRPVIATTIKS